MSSAESSAPLNLEANLPTRPEDVLALRQAKQGHALTLPEYLEFLTQLESQPRPIRRSNPGPRADALPFEL